MPAEAAVPEAPSSSPPIQRSATTRNEKPATPAVMHNDARLPLLVRTHQTGGITYIRCLNTRIPDWSLRPFYPSFFFASCLLLHELRMYTRLINGKDAQTRLARGKLRDWAVRV